MTISNKEGNPLFNFETNDLKLKPIIMDIASLMLLFNCNNKTLNDIKNDKTLLIKIKDLQKYLDKNYGGK